MALFLLLIIAAIVLGIIGILVHGLIYLLIIGIVVLVAIWCSSASARPGADVHSADLGPREFTTVDEPMSGPAAAGDTPPDFVGQAALFHLRLDLT